MSKAIKISVFACIMLAYIAVSSLADEADFRDKWCGSMGGQAEVCLPDGTRCDCLLDEYAVEVDFAAHWYQAVGQALHYGRIADRKPGICMIMNSKDAQRYMDRLQMAVEYYDLDIKIWAVK